MSLIRIRTMSEFNALHPSIKKELKNYCIAIVLMAGAAQIASIDLRHLAPKFNEELLSQYDVGDAVIAEIAREYAMGVFATFSSDNGDVDPREEVYTG